VLRLKRKGGKADKRATVVACPYTAVDAFTEIHARGTADTPRKSTP